MKSSVKGSKHPANSRNDRALLCFSCFASVVSGVPTGQGSILVGERVCLGIYATWWPGFALNLYWLGANQMTHRVLRKETFLPNCFHPKVTEKHKVITAPNPGLRPPYWEMQPSGSAQKPPANTHSYLPADSVSGPEFPIHRVSWRCSSFSLYAEPCFSDLRWQRLQKDAMDVIGKNLCILLQVHHWRDGAYIPNGPSLGTLRSRSWAWS